MTKLVRPSQQLVQRLLDLALGAGVHARRGLVQDQDARVGQHGAGDGEELALPLAQAAAALAQHRVVAVGQPLDELVGVRQLRGRHHFLVGRVRAGRSGCCSSPCR